jgi:hypothetical protein
MIPVFRSNVFRCKLEDGGCQQLVGINVLSCNEVIPRESKVSNTGQSRLVSAAGPFQNFVNVRGKPQSQAD